MGFGFTAKRGIVGEWYDGTWTLVDPEFAVLLWERIQDFGITEENYKKPKEESYNLYREENFVRIGRKYSVTYVITEKPKELNLRNVYENSKFILYSLPKG
ncbi:hypothetical protein IIA15_00925 [candidate division TA06 bacterium]|nr:hypothetical protein [candidate division TA06 bacterium]